MCIDTLALCSPATYAGVSSQSANSDSVSVETYVVDLERSKAISEEVAQNDFLARGGGHCAAAEQTSQGALGFPLCWCDRTYLYRPLACDAARCAPAPSFRLQCARDHSFITHQTGRSVCAWRASLPQHRLRLALSAPTHSRTVVSIPSA